ncbi:MAG: low-complexity protein [Chromatiales bacterium]
MRKINKLNPVAAAMGVALVTSMTALPAAAAQAADNPFGMTKLSSGYMVAGAHMGKEGKCGEGKCGGDKAKEGKCGEGKCGGDMKMKEGKCGEGKCGGDMKMKEGKCGEGKCGGNK